MKATSLAREWGRRIAHGVLGASVTAMAVALLDAEWARDAAGDAAKHSGLPLYLADAGLIAPLALAVGLATAAAGLVADPTVPPSPRRIAAALRIRAIGRPADVAAFVPLAVLGAFAWMTASAHLARAVLAIDVSPALSGVAIGAAALGLGFLAGLVVLALTPPLRRALATASDGRPAYVDPAVTGSAALVVVAALFAVGVGTGTVSGEGGLLGIYGIFKRPELDLRAAAALLTIAAGAFFAPAAVAGVRPVIAVAIALAPLALTVRASASLGPTVTQTLERGAPLGHAALVVLRKIADRDGDGMSDRFAGGDCDDADPGVNPGAIEIPDNGIDEDCSGTDLRAAALAKLAPPPAPVATGATTAEKPAIPPDLNIVLLTIDTLRAEVGFAGNPRPVTPNLDKLAARSTVFERAYSLASYTGKSVGPFLIGKYGSETHRNWGHSNMFTREDTLVSQRLSKAGFHTMSVQALRYFGKQSGLDRGFDVLDMSAAGGDGTIKQMENTPSGDRVSDAAIKLLSSPEHTGKRFFLWAHYLDPHADYLRHDDGPSFGTTQRDLYDGEIAFTDKHVGRVLDAIAAAPWGKNTAIIVTSDHGEAFGEHKMWRHGAELWEELVRVPLLIYVPGAKPSRVAPRRSAIDLVPTILELASLPLPNAPPPSNDFISGVSLVPDVFAAGGTSPATRDVLIDMPAGPNNDSRRSLIHGDLKLTISNGLQYELYDLAKDPNERENLWTDRAAATEILAQYEAAKARLREVRVTEPRE